MIKMTPIILRFIIFAFLLYVVDSKVGKFQFDISCYNLECNSNGKVCAIKPEGAGYRIRLFQDECALLNYKCAVKGNNGYEVTDMFYCSQAFHLDPAAVPSEYEPCEKYDCQHPADDLQVCGLRQDGAGFRIRIFKHKCALWEHNCEYNASFTITDSYICNGLEVPVTDINKQSSTDMPYKTNIGMNDIDVSKNADDQDNPTLGEEDIPTEEPDPKLGTNAEESTPPDDFYIIPDITNYISSNNNDSDNNNDPVRQKNSPENDDHLTKLGQHIEPETVSESGNTTNNNISRKIIVVHGFLPDLRRLNETIDRFFAGTHVFDLPIREMPRGYLNETTRRRLVQVAGPVQVFIPSIVIPGNTTDDDDHRATLYSCLHKCPTKCPSTYAPVCGKAGAEVREPALMFLNHCYMDVAQCKQFWENKSRSSKAAAYVPASFVFCLGDTLNHMYYFLPLVKTLQHMGRLPKKSRFRYRFTNFKYFNNLMSVKEPHIMG